MIKAEDIYKASNDGLSIITYYYPQATECVGTNKKFKRRPDESDASACIRQYKGVWKVTDFGEDDHAMSPIDICMNEERISFSEAIYLLADRYGVRNELDKTVNKPDIRKHPATVDEKDGETYWKLNDSFTKEQLAIMGPGVTQTVMDRYSWHSVQCLSMVKDRETLEKWTTPTYPIFMRQCALSDKEKEEVKQDSFYKIYHPLNPEKQYRFSYTPKGGKPRNYINGLHELKLAFTQLNAAEKEQYITEMGSEKGFVHKKLPSAFICSGERDAMCLAALNYDPIWFNSETYTLSEQEYKEIMKYVEVLYNIPDIDKTGIRKGTELALTYLDIHTVWLPSWLNNYKDQRSNPRKDLRDFRELRESKQDFNKLLAISMPAKFWMEGTDEKTGKAKLSLDTDCLIYFLKLNGFYRLKDPLTDTNIFVKVTGNVVEQIKPKYIRDFLKNFSRERFLHRNIRNLILNSTRLNDSSLESLDEIDLDFKDYDHDRQYFFFQKNTWEITGQSINEQKAGTTISGHYVMSDNIIKQDVTKLGDMFTIRRTKDAFGQPSFDIDINQHASNFFKYVINTSRTHWRKELEYLQEGVSDEEKKQYRTIHQFDIAGPLLNKEEIDEQKQNLVNKIFTIGYMLHGYKASSRAWAPYAMDNKIGEDGDSNGGSGKSFLFKTIGRFRNSVKMDGRNPKLLENPHVFEQVSRHTKMVLFDDCNRYFQTGSFYELITGDMTVNPKNNKIFTIEFEESPKIAFTTNFVPREFDPSSERRLLYMVFSDYYHQATVDNDYLETRSVRDDFHKDLFDAFYTKEEWNQDINFLAQCCRFYLSMCNESIKPQPPMGNILKRKNIADMGNSGFEDWAVAYFDKDSDHVNKTIPRSHAFDDFMLTAKPKLFTTNGFTKALKGFCQLYGYIYNPKSVMGGKNRIIEKVGEKTMEMIYIQTSEDEPINIDPNRAVDESEEELDKLLDSKPKELIF